MKPRHAFTLLESAIRDTPISLVIGPRQAGKSTLVKALPGYFYVTLDDPSQLLAAKTAPKAFLSALPDPVIIDEVQRAPELILPIKAVVDSGRKPGRFVLTGSADVLAMPAAGDSLAGRVQRIPVYPMTRLEAQFTIGMCNPIDMVFETQFGAQLCERSRIENLEREVVLGGYPEIVITRRDAPRRRTEWFAHYFAGLIDRDFRDQLSPREPAKLVRLLQLIAAMPANELNLTRLAADADLSQPNVRRYLDILSRIFIVTELKPWWSNPTKRLVKMPKAHFIDTGLLCHIAGYDEQGLRSNRDFFGHALENYVVAQLRAHAIWANSIVELFHYRSLDRGEIDLILERHDKKIVAIEIKASGEPASRDFRELRALREKLGTQFLRGLVAYDGSDLIGFGPDLFAIPIGWLV